VKPQPCLTAKAHLETVPAEQFPEKHVVTEEPAGQVAGRGPRQSPRQFQPKR
jgi:hypothetical protein